MATTNKPLRADAERNRRRILDAASELFAAKGLGVGLDEIAQHAGVGVATAYRRFPEKDVLIDALFEERADALQAAAEKGLAEADDWQCLVTFMTEAVALHAGDQALKQLVFQGTGGEARVKQIRARMAPLAKQILARAHASGRLRPEIEATDLIMSQFMVAGLGDFGSPAGFELWRRALDLVLDGLQVQTRKLTGRALTDEEFGRAVALRRR
jgi:AcrR family transcriptional regulator